MMRLLLSWLVLAATVLAGPAVMLTFLIAAFRGLDWPWYYCVPFVLAIVGQAFVVDWALGALVDHKRDRAEPQLRDEMRINN